MSVVSDVFITAGYFSYEAKEIILSSDHFRPLASGGDYREMGFKDISEYAGGGKCISDAFAAGVNYLEPKSFLIRLRDNLNKNKALVLNLTVIIHHEMDEEGDVKILLLKGPKGYYEWETLSGPCSF